jgi:predicted phosphodiesterase
MLMRLALFSDIHGNPIALNAVLSDLEQQGEIDGYWVLGDFVALGYDPVTPLKTITALPQVRCTRGNTDRYVVTQDLPVPPEKVLEQPALLAEVIGDQKLLLDTGLRERVGLAGLVDDLAAGSAHGLTRWHSSAGCSRGSRQRRWIGSSPHAE